jgi:hypothetical protein
VAARSKVGNVRYTLKHSDRGFESHSRHLHVSSVLSYAGSVLATG